MTPTFMGGVCFGAGLGITLFGIMYMFIHDGMVHRRFPVRHALFCRRHLLFRANASHTWNALLCGTAKYWELHYSTVPCSL